MALPTIIDAVEALPAFTRLANTIPGAGQRVTVGGLHGSSAAAMVAPGGLLVFAVCSLEREEGEEQIAAFLNDHPEFSRAPLTPEDLSGHGEWITAEGDLRTLPSHLANQGGMDGFYAARLRRS